MSHSLASGQLDMEDGSLDSPNSPRSLESLNILEANLRPVELDTSKVGAPSVTLSPSSVRMRERSLSGTSLLSGCSVSSAYSCPPLRSSPGSGGSDGSRDAGSSGRSPKDVDQDGCVWSGNIGAINVCEKNFIARSSSPLSFGSSPSDLHHSNNVATQPTSPMPNASPAYKSSSAIEREEYKLTSFDPWKARPLEAESQQVFVGSGEYCRFQKLRSEIDLMTPTPEEQQNPLALQDQTNRTNNAATGATSAQSTTISNDCPEWTRLWRHKRDGENHIDWEEDLWFLLEHAFHQDNGENAAAATSAAVQASPDFIGSSTSLKELFQIPYTDKAVSLLVCSADGSVFVGRTPETHFVSSSKEGDTSSFAVLEGLKNIGEQDNEKKSRNVPKSQPPQTTANPEQDMLAKQLLERFHTASKIDNNKNSATTATRETTTYKPRFETTLKWRFDKMVLVTGSNLRVFKDEDSIPLTASLHDVSQHVTSNFCLDNYLESRLAGITKFALALHRNGRVLDYRVYDVKDIPKLIGPQVLFEDNRKMTRQAFSPKLLEQRAAQLLHFLKERLEPGSTYWLFKEENSKVIHLSRQYCKAGLDSSAKSAKRSRERWCYTMAMLCARVASQYAHKRKAKDQQQTKKNKNCKQPNDVAHQLFLLQKERELLLKSLELLQEILADGGPPRLMLQAAMNEQVAETYIAEEERLREQGGLIDSNHQREHVHDKSFVGHLITKMRLSLAHFSLVANYLWIYRLSKDREDQEQTDADPDGEQALEEIQARLQRRVFFCFFRVATYHQQLGNIELVIQTITQGLLCNNTFRRWSLGWEKSHDLADLLSAFDLLGDTLIEASKRSLSSSSKGPTTKSHASWLEYATSIEENMVALVARVLRADNNGVADDKNDGADKNNDARRHSNDPMLTNTSNNNKSRETMPLPIPSKTETSALLLEEHAENVVAAECLSLTAIFLYGKAQLLAPTDSSEAVDESRKLGNAWNEIGKLRSTKGMFREARHAYLRGVECFRAAGDVSNATLLLCNVNHMFRSLSVSSTNTRTDENDNNRLMEQARVQQMYIFEGLEFLARAKALLEESGTNNTKNVWMERVQMETAMNHLLLGFGFAKTCRELVFQHDGEQSNLGNIAARSYRDECSTRTMHHFNHALQLYNGLKPRSALAKEKACAVHYHLALHLTWICDHNVVCAAAPDMRTTLELAKRKFMLALKGLKGEALKQCKRDFEAFLKQPKIHNS